MRRRSGEKDLMKRNPPRKLNIPMENRRYARYLLFWPVFGLRYILLERFLIPQQYHVVHCPLDDLIPFQEAFLVPYGLWYVFIIGMHLYTFFYDLPAFKRYTKFMITAFTLSTLTFILYPTCQNLRPTEFPRDNFMTDIVGVLYLVDTNTNVCPSEHVIGSVAAFLAAADVKRLQKPGLTVLFAVAAFFTSIATVFLKQHSVVDVLCALPVCFIAYCVCYCRKQPRTQGNSGVVRKQRRFVNSWRKPC